MKHFYKLAILLMALTISTSLMAVTYTVTEISDNGTGDVNTLSWAINQSNASTGVDDNIVFNLSSGSTLTISAALPIITDAVTIDGDDGGTHITVQVTTPGTSTFRVFNINASGETVNISNMTIRGGGLPSYNSGAGVLVDAGSVNIDNATISDGKAYGGGAIKIEDGAMVQVYVSTLCLSKFKISQIVLLGNSLVCMGTVAMLLSNYFLGLSVICLVCSNLLITLGGGLSVGPATSAALEPFPDHAGTASGIFGAIQYGLPALIGLVVTRFAMTSTLPLAVPILILSLIAFGLLTQLSKKKLDYARDCAAI